jgi:phosphoserine phosphatase
MPGSSLLPPALVAAVREAGRAMPGGVAAFDADGTLWRDDIGEAFLHRLIELGLVKLADGGDPYAEYERRVAADRASGFAYAAQLQKGLRRTDLERVASELAKVWVAPRLIESTQALLALCRDAGLVPTVVSASPIEIVRAGVPLAGIPVERCAGMTVREDESGLLTDELVGARTYAEGKVVTLHKRGWLPIALGCGDSIYGDLAMLAAAKVPVAVAPASGTALSRECEKQAWHVVAA